jgi:hypothetical protein
LAGLVLVAGVPLAMIVSAVRALAGRPHTVPPQNLGYTSRIPTLPGSDVVLTNKSVPIR